MAKILKGAVVRDSRLDELKEKISRLHRRPVLAIIQIGDRHDSNAYIREKKIFADKVGALVRHIRFSENEKDAAIIDAIKELNFDKSINGVIVQLPVPEKLPVYKIIDSIDPSKDVDGLTSFNLAKMLRNDDVVFTPAVARGIVSLLQYYKVPIRGSKVVVIGRSVLVGKPTALVMLKQDATVTVCHKGTKNLSRITRAADIIISAAGKPQLIGKRHVSRGQVVIDVGINAVSGKLEDEIKGRRISGDVDFTAVSNIVRAISPVPGGVGPMTVLSLFENLYESALLTDALGVK